MAVFSYSATFSLTFNGQQYTNEDVIFSYIVPWDVERVYSNSGPALGEIRACKPFLRAVWQCLSSFISAYFAF